MDLCQQQGSSLPPLNTSQHGTPKWENLVVNQGFKWWYFNWGNRISEWLNHGNTRHQNPLWVAGSCSGWPAISVEFSKEDREEKKASSGRGCHCFSEVSTRISAWLFPTIKWLVVQFNQNEIWYYQILPDITRYNHWFLLASAGEWPSWSPELMILRLSLGWDIQDSSRPQALLSSMYVTAKKNDTLDILNIQGKKHSEFSWSPWSPWSPYSPLTLSVVSDPDPIKKAQHPTRGSGSWGDRSGPRARSGKAESWSPVVTTGFNTKSWSTVMGVPYMGYPKKWMEK